MRSSENEFFRSPGPLGFLSPTIKVGSESATAIPEFIPKKFMSVGNHFVKHVKH